ncbi:EamA family transporter [Paractinoplanes lichenicola]|uniref:EamA family transporter n=1 Tax=Paractinoplanes lichenicola TaxID=2802976 RepID=A0ABS1VVS8_9ACTN|nr:EamA family transporter [Actinoplanes lichenicola]MBL7258591.1 EamA family transporter [Actinoplanes lichenicola]
MTFLGPLLIVYVVWGSTYLAQKVGLEGLPPLTMNAVRFLIAGALLYAYCRWRRMPPVTRPQWRAGAIQGLLLPAAGTGGAAWAEQWLSSGITALFLASIPLWIVLGRRVADHERIRWPVALGLAAGFAGVVVLARPSGGGDAVAIAVALGGALCWGLGTVYAGHAPRPASALRASAIEMLCAGAILVVLSGATGEWTRIDVTGRSAIAVGYLIVFGSLVAYTAYTWLLDHAPPRITGTYAFVNPVVAVLLGWWILGEPLTVRTLLATAVIAIGVALIVLAPGDRETSMARQDRGMRPPARRTSDRRLFSILRGDAGPGLVSGLTKRESSHDGWGGAGSRRGGLRHRR